MGEGGGARTRRAISAGGCEWVANSTWRDSFNFTASDGVRYDGSCGFFQGRPSVLTSTDGWLMILGVAGGGAFVVNCLCIFLKKLKWDLENRGRCGEFETPRKSRVIPPVGVVVCEVLSKVAWLSSVVHTGQLGFSHGLAGSYWHMAGSLWPLFLYAILSTEIREKFPNAASLVDLLGLRWGDAAHKIFLTIGLLSSLLNCIVLISSVSLLVGTLTGIPSLAVALMFSTTTVLITAQCGITGVHIISCFNVSLTVTLLWIALSKVFVGPSEIGSIDAMYQLLDVASAKVQGVADDVDLADPWGYWSVIRHPGANVLGAAMSLMGVGRIVGSQTLFATIQASPAKQCQNVITLAALSALAVPLCLGICLGMGARALDIPISRWEAENGLVSSAVAVHFFGRSGAWFAMLQACTSIAATASAELIGFAVTLNRDLYVRYIHAEASLQDQSTITMKSVWGCGFCVAVISSFMIYADASQNVVFYFAGILMNACVVPLIIAVTIQRNCPGAVVVGTVTGAVGGLFAWGIASVGLEVSATSDVAILVGNVISLLLPGLVYLVHSRQTLATFQWEIQEEIQDKIMPAFQAWSYSSSLNKRSSVRLFCFAFIALLLFIWPALAMAEGPNGSIFPAMVVVAAIFLCMTTVFGLVLPLTELFGRFNSRSLFQFLKMKWKKKDVLQWSQRHCDANDTPGANTSQSNGKGSGNPKSTAGSHATCLTREHSLTTSFNKYLSRLGSSVGGDDVDEGRFENGYFDADHFENDKSGRALNKQVVNQELRELKAVDFMEKKAETIRHQISATAKKSSWKRNIVMTVKKSYSWLTFGRAIKTERPSISRWEAMRWKSRSLTVLAVAVLTIVFCVICSVIYFAVGGWIAGLTILMHSIILVLCFVAIRVGSKTGMLSLTACMELVNYAQISLIMLVPMIMHVVLGGIDCGASSDWIIWTVLSPFIALFFIDGKHRTEEEKSNPFSTTYFNGFYFSKLVRQRRVRLVLWSRFVVFTFLIALDGSISRNGPENESRLDDSFHFYDSPPWLKTMFFIMNHIFCPLCIIAASRVTVMEFLHRRALIIEMKVEVNVAENMNKNLLQSLVPKFLVPELVKTPPVKWHLGSKDVFRDCSIIQMDLVGFTALSGSIDVEELVELLNNLFTTIDQCAARLGNVWKVDTIGDCYIGVVGGPEPCKDHASRAVMLAHCIIDTVKKVGANLDHELACRVGVHSGNVTAAFLGTIMPRYFIFGEDVNTTSMLETMGNPNEVHISASTAMALAEAWNARSLGQIELPRDSGNWVETYTINPSEDVSLAIGRLVDQDAAHCQALVKQWSSPDGDVAVAPAEMPPVPSPVMSVASAILRGNLTPLAARSRENSVILRSETPKGSEGGDGSPAEALAAYSRSNKHLKDKERAKSYTVGENRGAKIEIGNNPSVRKFSAHIHGMPNIGDNSSPAGSFKSGSIKSIVSGGSFKEVSFGDSIKTNTKCSPENSFKAKSTPSTPLGGSFKGVFSSILQGPSRDSSKPKATSLRKGLSGKGGGVVTKLPEAKDMSDPQSIDQVKEGAKQGEGGGSSPSAALKASIIKGGKSSLQIEIEAGSTKSGGNVSAGGSKAKTLLSPPAPCNDRDDSKHSLPRDCEEDSTRSSKKSDKEEGRRGSTKSDSKDGSKAAIIRTPSGNSSSKISKTATGNSDVLEAINAESDGQEKVASKADVIHDGTDWGTHMANKKGKRSVNGVGGGVIKDDDEGSEKDRARRRSQVVHDIKHIEPVKQELVEIVNDRKDVWQMDTNWFGKKKGKTTLNGAGEAMSRLFLKVSGISALVHGILHLAYELPALNSIRAGGGTTLTSMQENEDMALMIGFGVAPIVYAFVLLCMVTYANPITEEGRITFRFASEIILFVSPVTLVGTLDAAYAQSCILWSFSAPVLRCSFSGKKDQVWVMWMVLYIAGVVAFHVAISYSLDLKFCSSKLAMPVGWKRFLFILDHLLPTTMVLVPLSITSQQLSSDESKDQKLLDESLATMKQETQLLEALVPPSMAMRLQQGEVKIANGYDSVTVVFAYILDYTDAVPDDMVPVVIDWVDKVFCEFDHLLKKNLEGRVLKVEAFQNFFLAISGCPERDERHARNAIAAGYAMTRAASKIIRPNGLPTRVRVGACSGKVFAGVVGMDSPRFRIFGDTVNTAARMATNNDQEFYVHVTESTLQQLTPADLNWLYGVQGICVSKRGNGIQVKGKGKMQTYYLLNPMHSYQARKWLAPSCLQGMVEGVVSDLVSKVAKGVPNYRPPPVSTAVPIKIMGDSLDLEDDVERRGGKYRRRQSPVRAVGELLDQRDQYGVYHHGTTREQRRGKGSARSRRMSHEVRPSPFTHRGGPDMYHPRGNMSPGTGRRPPMSPHDDPIGQWRGMDVGPRPGMYGPQGGNMSPFMDQHGHMHYEGAAKIKVREWPGLKQKTLTRKNSSDSLASSMYSQNTQNLGRYEISRVSSRDSHDHEASSFDSRNDSVSTARSHGKKSESAFNNSFRRMGGLARMASMKSMIGARPLRQIVEGGRILNAQQSSRSDASGHRISDLQSSDDPPSQHDNHQAPAIPNTLQQLLSQDHGTDARGGASGKRSSAIHGHGYPPVHGGYPPVHGNMYQHPGFPSYMPGGYPSSAARPLPPKFSSRGNANSAFAGTFSSKLSRDGDPVAYRRKTNAEAMEALMRLDEEERAANSQEDDSEEDRAGADYGRRKFSAIDARRALGKHGSSGKRAMESPGGAWGTHQTSSGKLQLERDYNSRQFWHPEADAFDRVSSHTVSIQRSGSDESAGLLGLITGRLDSLDSKDN